VQVEQMPLLAVAIAVKKEIQKTIFECRRLCVNQSSKRLINLTFEHKFDGADYNLCSR